MIGTSRTSSLIWTRIGRIRAAIPRIRAMFATFEPTTLPIAMSPLCRTEATTPTSSSGIEVPMATTVSPMTSALTPRLRASRDAPRISTSAPR